MESVGYFFGNVLPPADSVFFFLLLTSILAFVGIEFFWVFRKFQAPEDLQVPKQHVDIFWSIIPAFILILLTRLS